MIIIIISWLRYLKGGIYSSKCPYNISTYRIRGDKTETCVAGLFFFAFLEKGAASHIMTR